MNFLLNLSLELRLAGLFVIGVFVAGQINHWTYRLTWRQIGPWLPPVEKAPPRRWFDRLPIVGWWTLRRESSIHGVGYWLRPMMVELLFGACLALLYWWEVDGGLTPKLIPVGFGKVAPVTPQSMTAIHLQFLSHAILLALMTAASLIDIDFKQIPDAITIPGTLLGLAVVAAAPACLLPVPQFGAIIVAEGVWITAPLAWPEWLNDSYGLAIGLGCLALWWLAILDLPILTARWYRRLGFNRGLRALGVVFMRRMRPRQGRPYDHASIGAKVLLVVLAAITGVWWAAQRDAIDLIHWRALLSGLVGMAVGGMLVWAVRIIGKWALKKEAMGFGDVMLVAMIGAFLGWQACLILFFMAPLAGTVVALLQFIVLRKQSIWYGPFLCLGACICIVCWAWLWQNYGDPIFGMGWMVPCILVVCLAMMWAMLTLWRAIKEIALSRFAEESK